MESHDSTHDSEQRWCAWQEKNRESDRLADKRMNILFSMVGAILLLAILYYSFQAKAIPGSGHEQHTVAMLRSTRNASC